MPELDEIVFVRTTMKEEPGAGAYTHGTQIYLGDPVFDKWLSDPEKEKDGLTFLPRF